METLQAQGVFHFKLSQLFAKKNTVVVKLAIFKMAAVAILERSKPHELQQWMTKINGKRMRLRRQKQRNLFAEAILANAMASLARTQRELRSKQQERLLRWRLLRAQMQNSSSGSEAGSRRFTNGSRAATEICEELRSLDEFMTQLKSVKGGADR